MIFATLIPLSTTGYSSGVPCFHINLEHGDKIEFTGLGGDKRPYHGWRFKSSTINDFLTRHIPKLLSPRLYAVLNVLYYAVDRLILILGTILIVSGAVTYGGICRGDRVFNGLGHFIKGGVFVWYGILTLSRWAGCFADFGWAWNIKPSTSVVGQFRASIPSAEFTESLVIFLYGITNVFLEHIAAWGGPWAPMDLEHLAITILFSGGGLYGMLAEKAPKWFDSPMTPPTAPAHLATQGDQDAPPNASKSRLFSGNLLPALVLLLLGIIMSYHHQSNHIAGEVHKQWGLLLIGFSLARGMSYILLTISPPLTTLPSRPPSEPVAAFFLTSTGLNLILSNKDIVAALESNGLDPVFTFIMSLGFTGFILAWTLVSIAVRNSAARTRLTAAL